MRWNWEEKPPCASAECDMVLYWANGNPILRMPVMRKMHGLHFLMPQLEVPVARLADDEVPEGLEFGRIFHFIRVAEVGVERRNIGVYR